MSNEHKDITALGRDSKSTDGWTIGNDSTADSNIILIGNKSKGAGGLSTERVPNNAVIIGNEIPFAENDVVNISTDRMDSANHHTHLPPHGIRLSTRNREIVVDNDRIELGGKYRGGNRNKIVVNTAEFDIKADRALQIKTAGHPERVEMNLLSNVAEINASYVTSDGQVNIGAVDAFKLHNTRGISIGNDSVDASDGIRIGRRNKGAGTIIGHGSEANHGGITLGTQSNSGAGGIVIGDLSSAQNNAVSIGGNANSSNGAVAIGASTRAGENSIAIGDGATASKPAEISIGHAISTHAEASRGAAIRIGTRTKRIQIPSWSSPLPATTTNTINAWYNEIRLDNGEIELTSVVQRFPGMWQSSIQPNNADRQLINKVSLKRGIELPLQSDGNPNGYLSGVREFHNAFPIVQMFPDRVEFIRTGHFILDMLPAQHSGWQVIVKEAQWTQEITLSSILEFRVFSETQCYVTSSSDFNNKYYLVNAEQFISPIYTVDGSWDDNCAPRILHIN